MKKFILRSFVVILIVALTIGYLPVSAAAAGNELVLTKIGHSKTDSATLTDLSVRAVTLTAPNRTTGTTIDLNTGLIVEKASPIGTVITSFDAGSVATIGEPGTPGPAVTMTVKYYKGSDTSTLYTTAYSISVVRAAKKAPAFTGTLSKSASGAMPNTETHDISFSAADFTALYAANDGADLGAVSIEGSNLVCGTLIYNSAPFTPGTPIPLSSLGNLWFDATAAGSVSYIVRAYAGTDVTTPIGSVLMNITVSSVTVPTITGSVSKSVSTGSSVTFAASDFTSCSNMNNGTFIGVEITPTNSGYGTWYNGSGAFTGTTSFTASTIGNLKFTGSTTGSAGFTWRISNEAGLSLSGSGSVTVNSPQVNISYSTAQNTPKTFAAADFYTPFANATGYPLNSIYFSTLPSSSYGTLYYGYSSASSPGSAAAASSAFYYGSSPAISSVTFVPASGFTGTVSIPYVAVATNNTTYLTGTIQITVSGGSMNISYSTAQNTPKTFAAADFYTPFASATSNPLNYIYFSSLPSSSYGTLYSGYSSASSPGSVCAASSAYYYSSTPAIASVTFVPASGFSGTVSIPYVAVATNNSTYLTGTIQITISGGSMNISYSTAQNTPKTFAAADFYTPFASATSNPLNYIYFSSLPSSSYGTLYSGYSSASSPGSVCAASSAYYYNSTPAIASVTFVPASGFSGTVSIPYVAVATNNTTYLTGTIQITVSGGSLNISYSTAQNTPKTFAAADFYTPFANATGNPLYYIYFSSLPSSAYGTLYSGYSSASSPGSACAASAAYYYSSTPAISSVTFVPASGFSGTVSIPYVAVATNNTTYLTGTIQITVSGGSIDISYSTAKNTPKTFAAADFYTPFYSATGNPLYYIYFSSLPSSSYGTLYSGYSSASSPGSACAASSAYYYSSTPAIASVTFVPASGFTGTVSIPYVAVATNNTTYTTGTILITVSGNSGVSAYFSDVGTTYSWAVEDIDYLYGLKVVNGTGNGQFSPSNAITRGDFLLMLYRMIGYRSSSTANFTDVPKGSYYYDAIAAAKALGIAIGTNNTISPTIPVTRQDAVLWIYRALGVKNITVAAGSASDIAGFSDKDNIASYAVNAVQALVKAGIIKGADGKLLPTGNLSRAEMAVVMSRVYKKFLTA